MKKLNLKRLTRMSDSKCIRVKQFAKWIMDNDLNKPERRIMMYGNHFKEFYDSLPQKVQEKYKYKFKQIKNTPTFVPKSVFKEVEGHDGLYEIKFKYNGIAYRTFTTFDKGNIIVLYNSIIKKKQKTPHNSLENADKLVKEYGGDQSKLTEFEIDDSADSAVEMAVRVYEDYLNGIGDVTEIDFIDFVDDSVNFDNSEWYSKFTKNVLYIETERYYLDDELIWCGLYVWSGSEQTAKRKSEISETEQEDGFTIKTNKAEYYSNDEGDIDRWIRNFVSDMNKQDVECHIEYLY